MGRPRFRTELLLDATWHERDHALFAAKLYGTRFETIPENAERSTYYRLAKPIDEDGRFVLRAGLSHLTLAEKISGKPLLLINMIGEDANETAFRKQVAEAKKWVVTTEAIEMFGSLFTDDDPHLLALLAKCEDGDQPTCRST